MNEFFSCVNSVFNNPTFSEGAIAGGLNSGGHSNGWKANSGNPKVNEGQFESLDGWTIQLSGNIDSSDVLTSIEPICIEKGNGLVNLRIAVGDSGVQFSSKINIQLFTGDHFNLHEDNNGQRHLIQIACDGFEKHKWYDVQVPYDISDYESMRAYFNLP